MKKISSKPAIVILHGWGLSAARFAPLTRALRKKGLRVYVPDLPGFGNSAMPKRPYTLSDYVLFLISYIRQHNLKRVILIGHSFGGRITLKFAGTRPQELAAIVLTGVPGVTPVPRKKLLLFIMFAKIGKFFFSVWPLSMLQEKIRPWYYWFVGAREYYRAEGVMRETFKHIVKEELVSSMRQVSVPCLLVWGAQDQITPVWIAHTMHETMKDSLLVLIPNRDHGVPYKDSELFVKHINTFVSSL